MPSDEWKISSLKNQLKASRQQVKLLGEALEAQAEAFETKAEGQKDLMDTGNSVASGAHYMAVEAARILRWIKRSNIDDY